MSENHDPNHSHDAVGPPVDAAQQSLSDALKVSFVLLKAAMIFLVIGYLLTGMFGVEAHELAVRLQFGTIVNEDDDPVYGPGWHFGLPFPIGDKIRVQVTPQTLSINKAFWYELNERNQNLSPQERAQSAGPLNPEKDGSLLTGDANIVHARFEVTYEVSRNKLVNYVKNIGSPELAERAVRSAAEHGIIQAVAMVEADDLINGQFDQDLAKSLTQDALDRMETGIEVKTFTAGTTTMPLAVESAYQAVSNAENERAQKIEAARKDYSRILSEAAGQARNDLYNLVREYEQAAALNDEKRLADLQAELDDAFSSSNTGLKMSDARGGLQIGGQAAQVINEARTYRTQTVETVKAEAQTFELLYKEYQRNPRILVNRLLEDTREAVFAGDVETIYAPTDSLYIETNRDPDVQRRREEEKLRTAEMERRMRQMQR